MPDDEEKRLRALAEELDKGDSYYEKRMGKKAEQSRMAQLQAPPKRGKKPPVSEEAVEEAVRKRKAPFMYRPDYQIGEKPLGTVTAEEKLELPTERKFPERAKREWDLAKRYHIAKIAFGMDDARTSSQEKAAEALRTAWYVDRNIMKKPKTLAYKDYLVFVEDKVKRMEWLGGLRPHPSKEAPKYVPHPL